MGTSQDGASGSGGCFSGVLRVLFCRSKLQTHPERESPEMQTKTPSVEEQMTEKTSLKRVAAVATPGVVARLMGLDSFPLDAEWMRSEKSHSILDSSVRRCRSVNFMEYLLELDISKKSRQEEGQHRRVKTSVSFREVSKPFAQGDQDLLVLYLNNQVKTTTKETSEVAVKHQKQKVAGKESSRVGKTKEKGPQREGSRVPEMREGLRKAARKEVSSRSGVQKRRNGGQKPKARRPMSKPVKEKELLEESKFMKTMKKRTKKPSQREQVETLFSPEGRSPDSVLDNIAVDSPVHDELISFSDDADSTSLNSMSSCSSRKEKRRIYNSGENHHDNYIELFIQLRKLTDDEAGAASWRAKSLLATQSLEDLCSDLEHVILDNLVAQMVQELGVPGTLTS